MEVKRKQWTTSENLRKHYDVVAKTAVEAGIAEWNSSYDPNLRGTDQNWDDERYVLHHLFVCFSPTK